MASIGQIVRDRRDVLGLEPHAVAEQADVPLDALVAFEDDEGKITAAALDRVARVLAIDPLALREGRLALRPTAALFFQQMSTFPDFRHEDESPVALALERATNLLEVNDLLGRPPSLRSRCEPLEPIAEAAKDGYRLAARVRAMLGNETKPLSNLVHILEEDFDILVRAEALASSLVDALSAKDNESGAAAVILNLATTRRANPHTARVDLAHELAHVLFDPANGRVNLVVDEDGKENKSATLAEQRARAFAAEFLMPAEGLRDLLGKPQYAMGMEEAMGIVDRVRSEFVTPIEIAVTHLVNREYVWSQIRTKLIDQARGREPARGPSAARIDLSGGPDVLLRRVRDALDHDLVTEGRARELLGLSPWDALPSSA
jgi:Zn-dependent peptidase ImmA (M78 family)